MTLPPTMSPAPIAAGHRLPKTRTRDVIQAIFAGIDASLVMAVLGVVFSLIAYAGFGPSALPFSLFATTVALLVGGIATMLASRDLSMISGPTAAGALVIASTVRDLQAIDAARGSLEAAALGAAVVVIATALLQILFARLRIGAALKFVPFPVLMGFANTVALLLIISIAPAALGHEFPGRLVELARWFDDWRPAALLVAAIGTAAGLAAARWLPTFPSAFIALVVATAAQAVGAAGCDSCRLGPALQLGGSMTATSAVSVMPQWSHVPSLSALGVAYWSVVLQAALVLAVLGSLFTLLTAAQHSRTLDPAVDGNKLLWSFGIGNLCSGALVGLPVSLVAAPTRAIRTGAGRPVVAITVYFVVVLLIFTIGRRWFALLPLAAVASAVFVSSRVMFDAATWPLLRQAMRGRAARKASIGPLAIAGLVVAVGLFRGLAAALFVGALAAVCLLAIEMRRSVVLAVDDARTRRSRRVRTGRETELLNASGEQVRIVVLGHWLYFGTADELGDILERQTKARWLLLDLGGVAGIDLTAARSLIHSAERLAARGMHLVAAGLPDGDGRRDALEVFRAANGSLPLTLVATLDEALEQVEDALLGDSQERPNDRPLLLPGMTDADALRLAPWLEPVLIAARAMLFRAGDPGDAVYAIRSGRITISLDGPGRSKRRLLTFGTHGLFGELALLDRRPRSADAVADTDCELWMLTRARLEEMAQADHALHAKVLNGIALHLAHRLRDTTRLLDLR